MNELNRDWRGRKFLKWSDILLNLVYFILITAVLTAAFWLAATLVFQNS